MASILIRTSTPMRGDFAGGAARLMENIAIALKEKGWEVAFLCPKDHQSSKATETVVPVYEFGYKPPESPISKIVQTVKGATTLKRIFEMHHFDIVLDEISHEPFYPAHFLSPKETTNAMFLHTTYLSSSINFLGLPKGIVVSLIEQTLPYSADPEIVCAGPSTKQRVEQGLRHSKTRMLRPCIDIEDFNFNFEGDSKTILYLGRLTKRKNVSCLLNAWSLIEEKYEEYNLVIAGTGIHEDELMKQARNLSLKRVEFKGFVSEKEKLELLENSLAFVIPSLLEGYVTTGLEALASGTPVIGADTYGINDYVRNGVNGYLFPKNDYQALATCISKAIDYPSQFEEMANNGQLLAKDHSFNRFKDRADTLFTKML